MVVAVVGGYCDDVVGKVGDVCVRMFVDMVVVVVVVIGVWWWLWLVVIVMMWWVRLGMCV